MRTPHTSIAALALGLAALAGLAPASAATDDDPGRYAALGDSYAAGTGTMTTPNECGRSESAYPARLAGAAGYSDTFDFLACAGATTMIPLTDIPPYWQTSLVSPDTEVVTLTIGGNDWLWFMAGSPQRWVDVLQACLYVDGVLGAPGCRDRITEGPDLAGLSSRISGMIAEIAALAPDAEILVSGYPELFGPFPAPTCGVGTATITTGGTPVAELPVLVARQDARWISQQSRIVNSRIREAVGAARAAGYDVSFVDVAPAFRGHGLCDRSVPWMNGAQGVTVETTTASVSVAPQSFHLNVFGDTAYAERFLVRGFGG
ncbi:MAG: SGNH/GDSL hydrolase family protein [Actinomycetales bacterium]|nr:SGNH/GDSL hydrolase family protein [Actinomycetales bacterium]